MLSDGRRKFQRSKKGMPQKFTEFLKPITVDEINVLTERARRLPPSGDQSHVIVEDGEDPWIIAHGNDFLYCTVDRRKRKILVSRFKELKEAASAELKQIWSENSVGAPAYIEIWSPELHCIDDRWYVYFALYNGNTGQERLYVIEGVSQDPQGEYVFKAKLNIETDRWAIDGSILEMPSGGRYFIWSGWDGDRNESQNIYIAEMSDPWTLISDRVCLSRPEYDWEKVGYPHVNEGPQALINKDKVFIIYSASGSWTDDYCLGRLTYLGGDPLNAAAWRKEAEPVFKKTETIFGVGHCSFVKDRAGQDWIVYHAARSSRAGWARQIRIKPFAWNEDGSPDFGQPL
jgi:GH43 family beta-xylosidase